MKNYTVYIDDGNSAFVCEVSAQDVKHAEKELQSYMNEEGETYRKDPYKSPSLYRFIKYYFGFNPELDPEPGFEFDSYEMPNRFICTNRDVAAQMYELLKLISYHNTFRQKYRKLERRGNIIDIIDGDY